MKKLFLVFLIGLVSSFIPSDAQQFFKTENKPLTFKEMQKQFQEWKSSHNLSKQRNWKYFKRWENEMQMHTDGQGNPADPSIFFDAIDKANADKDKLRNSSAANPVSWLPKGPFDLPVNNTGYMETGMGRVNCIAFHPTDAATYYVGVAQGGLWKTNNNGQTWTPLTDNLPITRISDIAINPVNPDEIYISLCDFAYIGFGLNLNGRKRNTHYGLGVYKTLDGGLTWNYGYSYCSRPRL